MVEIQEGDEVRTGLPIVDVVNPATMRVRARVNQADVRELQIGQQGPRRARRLSGADVLRHHHPDFSDRRAVVALAESAQLHRPGSVVNGAHPNLMPDLTASLDVELARAPGALVVPRDAVGYDGEQAYVRVQRGDTFERRDIASARRTPTRSSCRADSRRAPSWRGT